ncbi:hypothetical protein ACFYY2_20205 [Streptomyces sp. NPDC001822]|uniref:hypothetical protein n=1 Tax=Streptomyces sp. NPDC001822 TaxID=3364614 RepID=UPI0036B940B8
MLRTIKKFRLAVIALVAAAAVTVGFAGPAFAYNGLPGETNSWANEVENNVPLRSSATVSEAFDNNGNLLQVWRGADNDNIWVSFNHGPPQAWPSGAGAGATAHTYAAPRVIYTSYGFRVFHTGTDGHIYYAGLRYATNIIQLGGWVQVPNNTVTASWSPPSATALPNGSWYLVWTGATGLDVWGTYFNGPNGTYSLPRNIPGAETIGSPAISFDSSWNQIVVTWRGLDNFVYFSRQWYGQSDWSTPAALGGIRTNQDPAVRLLGNGYGAITIQNAADRTLHTAVISRDGRANAWYDETSHWQSNSIVWLTAVGTILYYIFTADNGLVYWKQAGNFNAFPPAGPSS